MKDELIGQCFVTETSWGDEGPPWRVYRRVRQVMAGIARCHRFEVRSPQMGIGGGPMYVFYPEDIISVRTLLTHERIVDCAVWGAWWERFIREIEEPWNGE